MSGSDAISYRLRKKRMTRQRTRRLQYFTCARAWRHGRKSNFYEFAPYCRPVPPGQRRGELRGSKGADGSARLISIILRRNGWIVQGLTHISYTLSAVVRCTPSCLLSVCLGLEQGVLTQLCAFGCARLVRTGLAGPSRRNSMRNAGYQGESAASAGEVNTGGVDISQGLSHLRRCV